MIRTQQVGISIIVIGVATMLMGGYSTSIGKPASISSQPAVSVKDLPTKVKKDPPRKRFVKRCGFVRGKRVCRLVPVPVRGPGPRPTPY